MIKANGLLGWIILSIFSFSFSVCQAQSKLKYDLRVGTTGQVTLLDSFPESYSSEKINISILLSEFSIRNLDSLDFVFADKFLPELGVWGDSICHYADESEAEWTVWKSRKETKNKKEKVMRQNACEAFETYVRKAMDSRRGGTAWLGWMCASLLLMAGLVYVFVQLYRRRAEKKLSSVEQEMLRRKRMGNRRHYGSQLYLWLLLLVLYAPIALIVVFSFTKSKILGNWTGFSFELYSNLFTGKADAGLNSAIGYTVLIALIAAVCSTILGTLAAIGIYNMRARQRKAISFLNSVPMINPDIITGISLFLLFVALGISQGLATVCIAHVVFCTPYVVLSVLPRLSRMNPNTYEAALDLGATPFQALRKVMMPELWPGMLSGFILALTLSVDDFGVTFFTKGSGGLETLSTFIYSDARKGGLTPELRPLFTIILIVMLAALVIINIRDKKKENRQ